MSITVQQIKAARALLEWDQDELAARAGLSKDQVKRFETGQTRKIDVQDAMHRAFVANGIEFIEGGVRKRQGQLTEYTGADGFRAFMDDVYATVKAEGGLVCVHNVDPDNWVKWLGREWNAAHTVRMQKIEKPFNYRITIRQNDLNLLGKHAEYRWLPGESWNEQSFYAYGDKLALMLFEPDAVTIRVVHSRQFAEGFRALFNMAWKNIPPIVRPEQI